MPIQEAPRESDCDLRLGRLVGARPLEVFLLMSSASMVLALALVLSGCSLRSEYELAREASRAFDLLMDRREYTALYDQASARFQASATREQVVGYLARINRTIGRCEGESRISVISYNASSSGTWVTTRSLRNCANGALEEDFVWEISRRRAVLLHYSAESPLLLMDQRPAYRQPGIPLLGPTQRTGTRGPTYRKPSAWA